jgi:membrane protease YdiL (CAAX protease family)
MFAPVAYGHVGFVGWYFIGVLAFIGWASFRSRKRIATVAVLPSRARHFVTTILVLSLILVLALLVARVDRIPLFPRTMPTLLQIGAGIAIAGVLAACMRPLWRQSVAQGDRRIYFFTPSNALERGLWIGVSLVAGVGEEVTYRGVLYVLFLTLTHSPWAAALLSAAWFAAGHAVQSARSMAIIFLFSLVFQGLALWTGALYVAMLAHFLYDVIAGLTYSRLAREMGYQPPCAVGAAAAAPEPAGG